jgi:hypothetical protein
MGYRKRTVAKTGEITDIIEDDVPEDVPEAEVENTAEIPDAEDAAAKRKQEIADKRRASLALARSKIIPKSTIKKQAEEVIKGKDAQLKNKQDETDAMRLKYEKERVKQLEDSLMTLQKLVAERPTPVAEPVAVAVAAEKPKYKRPSRAKSANQDKPSQSGSPFGSKHDVPSRQPQQPQQTQQPQQIIPKKSVEPRMLARPSTETLIDKSYGEQLQERLRAQALNRIMSDTFGGF